MNLNLKRTSAATLSALVVIAATSACVILPPPLPNQPSASTEPIPHPGRDSGDKEDPSATPVDDRVINGDACAQLVNDWYGWALDPTDIQYAGSSTLDDVTAGEGIACTITVTNMGELASAADQGLEELTVVIIPAPSAELESKIAEFAQNEGMSTDRNLIGQEVTGGNVVKSFWVGELPEGNATDLPPATPDNWTYSNTLLHATLSDDINGQAAKDQFQTSTGVTLDDSSQVLLYGYGWQLIG